MNGLRYLALSLMALSFACPTAAQERTAQEEQMLESMRKAARAQGINLTPEMEEQALQRARDIQASMLGLQVGMGTMRPQRESQPQTTQDLEVPSQALQPTPTASTDTAVPAPVASSTSLAATANSLREAIAAHREHARPSRIHVSRDGFDVNGRPFLDPAGVIERYGANFRTGDVTYFVDEGGGNFTVRFANVNSGLPPVTVGTFTLSRDRMAFTGVDGTELAGHDVIPLSTGLLASRSGAFFRYEFGSTPESFRLENGYDLLPMQAGDVISTGWVLASRKGVETTLDRMLPSMKASFFRNREPDFAIVDTRSGNMVTIPRSEPATEFSRARLYDREMGRPRRNHYFNAIDWRPSPVGPVVIYLNDRGTEVLAIRLDTGEELRLFRRAAGINGFDTRQLDDGDVAVTAQLAFRQETVNIGDAFNGLANPVEDD